MRSVFWQGLLGLSLLVFAGCATEHRVPLTGDPIVDSKTAIESGPRRDRVLWEYRGAAAYMRKGQFADAKRLLDDALLTLGGNITADANSRKARSYFHSESKKNFIGEPYERVMAYYYRGILYWMDGEPDNARACFRSGQLEDADAENKTYAADYILLDYLDGFATAKLAGDGSDAYQRARKLDKSGTLPPYDTKANVLFFLEFGHGPEKYASGEHGEELRFRAGSSVAKRAVITIDNQTVTAPAYDDLTFQATTRGGRVMDHILGNKAVFKDVTGAVGVGAMVGGAILMADRNTRDRGGHSCRRLANRNRLRRHHAGRRHPLLG